MTDISFYHLTASSLEMALPKLLEKALKHGHRILILAESEALIARLDEWLWTYNPAGFLPHGTTRDAHAARQPVLLTTEDSNPNQADVLVLPDGREPMTLDGYARVLDLFDGRHAPSVSAARERWQRRKQEGHALTYWQQNTAGGWEKAA